MPLFYQTVDRIFLDNPLTCEAMPSNHEIQQAIETRWGNREPKEAPKTRVIRDAVNRGIADEAERTTRESGQDLVSKNLDPTGNYYPFRILQKNKEVERVVVEWFKVRLQNPFLLRSLM